MMILVRGLAAAFAVVAFLAPPDAFADTRTIQGRSLVLTSALSNDVVIASDSHLSGQIRVSMEGDTSCLSVTQADAVLVNLSGCSAASGRLTITVPRGMPLTISSSGAGDLRLADDIHAPLTITLDGSGDVVGRKVVGTLTLVDHGRSDVSLGEIAGPVVLDMNGSGDVRLSSVAGPLMLRHEGNGDLAVGHIETDSLIIDSTGSGDVLVGRGSIGTLKAHLQGNGDLGIAADIHDGDVRAFGGGDVKLGLVTGTLTKANGDNSEIYVGGPAVVDTIVGQVAKSIADSPKGSATSRSGHSGGVHVLMLLVLGIAAFILWRIMRKPGGRWSARGRAPAAPSHPGVLALCEKMSRMEERLGRVEGYVTSREFDLQQKFRNL